VTDVNAAEGIGLPVADDPRDPHSAAAIDGTRQPPRNERVRPGGRPAPTGNRIVPPVQGGRHAIGEATERPTIPLARGESTVDLNSVTEPLVMPGDAGQHGSTGQAPPVPPRAGPPTQSAGVTSWPSRPAPDVAAAEVWALVERAQRGDAEAFGLIYDRYMDTVFRFIYFRVGSRPLAEDLTADTFLRALKRIGSFTWQGRDLGAWLVTIARNLVADHFKSGRYRLEVTTGDVLDADKAERGPEGSPEAAVVDHITNVALLRAVKQLNPEQQECIVLRFLHGFSVAETAQAMGKNEGAIKALQYRAVRALHRLLPEGFQP
jgi:RNA polymerase sigma-70 factor, ECF subfamily